MTKASRLAIEGGRPLAADLRLRRWPVHDRFEREALTRVLESGVWSGLYAPETTQFQEEYQEFIGARHALLLNSGTAALHCALVGARIVPGDEVLVPALTMSATWHAVLHAGATPVGVDVTADGVGIDPADARRLIGPATRAIMPVHVDGLPADMDGVMQLAADHPQIVVVEDAAQVHGGTYRGRSLGTFGHGAGFSLTGSKNLPGGEGGVYVTDDDDAYAAARALACFGERIDFPGTPETRTFVSQASGYQYRPTEFTAAVARGGLRRVQAHNYRADENARRFREVLRDVPGFAFPVVPGADDPQTVPPVWKLRVIVDPAAWDWSGSPTELTARVASAVGQEGVPVGRWQAVPIGDHPAFRAEKPSVPWHPSPRPDAPRRAMRARDLSAYPNTRRLLDRSFVVGAEFTPLYVQSTEVIEAWANALVKVWERRDAVRTLPFDHFPSRPELEI